MKYSSPFPILLCVAFVLVLSFALCVPSGFAADKTANAKEPAAAEQSDEADVEEANLDEDDVEEANADEANAEEADAEETEGENAEGGSTNEAASDEPADQTGGAEKAEASETVNDAAADSAEDGSTQTGKDSANETPSKSDSESGKELSILDLLKSGGVLMIPIAIISVLVVMVGLERFFGLCSWFVLPRRLMHNVDVQVSAKADPRAIYALCRRNHSALSNVIQAAIFKAGRPMPEVQNAIEHAKENEANRLYSRVRLLVLAASITPLIGLLGTVVGMIQAFMATASADGVHKAAMLSVGIYTALVTTCAGLAVAIPAAILAHWYEGKIQRLFYRMDQKLINFVAYLEALEGKVHLSPAAYKDYVKQKNRKS